MKGLIQLVRQLALELPGVEEAVCFETAAFSVRKKLMLRFREDGETLVVKFPLAERDAAIAGDPDVFSVTDHYRNYPIILVNLLAVRREKLGALIEGAWRMLASQTQIAAYKRARE